MRKPDDPTGSTDAGHDETFYSRWSRRKSRERAGQPQPPAPRPAAGPREPAPAPAQPAPRKVLTDEDMPAVESLGEDDDYSGFLSPGVSEALRTRALRKLFSSSKFNVVDRLNDYDEDYTSFAPLGDVVTAEMRYRAEVEAERARRRAEEQARAAAGAEPGHSEAGQLAAAGDEEQAAADATTAPAEPPAADSMPCAEEPAQARAGGGGEEGGDGEPREEGEPVPPAAAPVPARDA